MLGKINHLVMLTVPKLPFRSAQYLRHRLLRIRIPQATNQLSAFFSQRPHVFRNLGCRIMLSVFAIFVCGVLGCNEQTAMTTSVDSPQQQTDVAAPINTAETQPLALSQLPMVDREAAGESQDPSNQDLQKGQDQSKAISSEEFIRRWESYPNQFGEVENTAKWRRKKRHVQGETCPLIKFCSSTGINRRDHWNLVDFPC